MDRSKKSARYKKAYSPAVNVTWWVQLIWITQRWWIFWIQITWAALYVEFNRYDHTDMPFIHHIHSLIPMYSFGFISNQYRYMFIEPIPIPHTDKDINVFLLEKGVGGIFQGFLLWGGWMEPLPTTPLLPRRN